MELFIDESGNLGRKDRFFVIALLYPANKKRLLNIAKHFNARMGIGEIKGSDLLVSDKQHLLFKMNKEPDYSISYIVADKQYINSPKLRQDKNLCFNYLFMHLLQPIISQINEDVNIIADEHSVRVGSKNSLQDYIRIKAYYEWSFRKSVNISFIDSKQSKLVQIADLAANIIHARYNYDKRHLYEMLNINYSVRFPHVWFGS